MHRYLVLPRGEEKVSPALMRHVGLWLETVAGSRRRWGEGEELGSSTHLTHPLFSSADLQEPEDHRGNCAICPLSALAKPSWGGGCPGSGAVTILPHPYSVLTAPYLSLCLPPYLLSSCPISAGNT